MRHFDSLGRMYKEVFDNTLDDAETRVTWSTQYTHDIEGRVLTVTDGRGVLSLTSSYDGLGQLVRAVSPDSGTVKTLAAVDGQAVVQWPALGGEVRRGHDTLRRLTEVVVDDGVAPRVTQRLWYGDDDEDTALLDANALGQVILHYDEAGLVRTEAYDFAGRMTSQSRYLRSSSADDTDWSAVSTADDWGGLVAAAGLELSGYPTGLTYDVAGRVLTATTADGRLTERSYDLAGRLATVDVGAQEVVAAVGYNARGQRLSITYGNGTSTTYAYDPKTFRLTRATTARSSDRRPAPKSLNPRNSK